MSDVPHFRKSVWLEYGVTAVVLGISILSLWVAVGTEDANRRMVAAASWPFLKISDGNADEQGRPRLMFSVGNSGVGPAKVESFEVFWKGKAYSRSYELLRDCCGLDLPAYQAATYRHEATPIIDDKVAGRVIRAGETVTFLDIKMGADNEKLWHALDQARRDIRYRICYCSVFDECWSNDRNDLNPARVKSCEAPKVPYIN
jgi:hypothetical protein